MYIIVRKDWHPGLSTCNLIDGELSLIEKMNSVIRFAEAKSIFVEFFVYTSVYYRTTPKGSLQCVDEFREKGIGLTVVNDGKEEIFSFDGMDFEKIERKCYQILGFTKKDYFKDEITVKGYGYKKDYFSTKGFIHKVNQFFKNNQEEGVDLVISCQFEEIMVANNYSFACDGRLFQKLIVSENGEIVKTLSSNDRTFIGDKYKRCYKKAELCTENKERKYDRILFAPMASGMLMHEICGHMLENDFFIQGNSLFKCIGQRVCNSTISVYDNPYRMYGKIKHIDDEGNILKKTPLIVRGKLTGLLGCRYAQTTDKKLPFASKARRESHEYVPTGRSFCIELVSSNCKKISVSELQDVLVVKTFSSSSFVPATNEVKCESSELYLFDADGQLIKIKGELKIRLKGNDFLRNIISVYDDYTYQENMCYSSSGHVSAATYTPSIMMDNTSLSIKIAAAS
ncbi:hypothetical protein ASU35_13520 [Acetivibrio ethanolgignens]|uniref:Metalloprotease TldD/E C-terminal domain-containing protein n=2 Tax=Acetivibrio ethanolgignens TaxID=290052 RepID=A0A0V8QCU8_9FIRM|nr:hypothetical protein ASU35_13520 [Acetivibrio ethanolgignens]